MIPVFTINDIANGCGRYTELLTKALHRYAAFSISCANVQHLIIGQLRDTVRLAACLAALFQHVLRVVFVCSQKQMFWAAATAVVAVVKAGQPIWNWAVGNSVGESVGRDGVVFPKWKIAVSLAVCATSVQPALARTINLRPEAGNIVSGILRGHIEPPFDVSRHGRLQPRRGFLMLNYTIDAGDRRRIIEAVQAWTY